MYCVLNCTFFYLFHEGDLELMIFHFGLHHLSFGAGFLLPSIP